MLLSFRVANYRSLRGEQVLSFVAPNTEESNVRLTGLRVDGREVGTVPSIGIFGANASGKSNLLAAIRAMRHAVLNSVVEWVRGEGVPREPFALNPACHDEATLFEVNLLLGATRYVYSFQLSDERVEAECLLAYPNGRKQIWFERDADRKDSGGAEFRFPGEGLKGQREKIVELTRPNALFLTVAASFNHEQLSPIYRWFQDNFWLVTSGRDLSNRYRYTKDMVVKSRDRDRYRKRIESLLRVADLGITGLVVDAALPDDEQVRLLHETPSGESMPLDFRTQESLGTYAWFAFLGPVLKVLEQGSVLLADELDSSLHPILAAEVIRLFQDPNANPNGAQLIFTTHDATMLGNAIFDRPLDRNQVWITTKRKTGETELYPLLDAHPRPEENMERRYLRGHYGGVPNMVEGEIAREVAYTLAAAG